jgi:D-3-phosphoglycerate dehydrogenase / 2-oxoglutarate reductase
MKKIYVALSTFSKESPEPLNLLKKSGFEFTVNMSGKRLTKGEVIASLKDYDGVVAGLEPYDQEVIESLPQLKCISRCGVGVDNIDLSAAKSKNITVLNTPQVVIQPVAELTLALIFDLLRRTTEHTIAMRQKKWERLTGNQLAGKTVGVVGLGRIGRKVAQVLRALDAHVIGYDVYPDHEWSKANQVVLVDFYTLLKESDIVTLHLAATTAHPFELSREELAHMKNGAFLINVSRGSLVDEQALVEALKAGHLGGVGLDVYEQEPYAGPLCDMPNVVLTPHIATLTSESRGQMEAEAVDNILRFFAK